MATFSGPDSKGQESIVMKISEWRLVAWAFSPEDIDELDWDAAKNRDGDEELAGLVSAKAAEAAHHYVVETPSPVTEGMVESAIYDALYDSELIDDIAGDVGEPVIKIQESAYLVERTASGLVLRTNDGGEFVIMIQKSK